MKKIIIGFIVGLLLGTFITVSFSDSKYREYSEGRWPDQADSIKAEINQAEAIQKIAEEGITLNIVFKNKLEVDKKE